VPPPGSSASWVNALFKLIYCRPLSKIAKRRGRVIQWWRRVTHLLSPRVKAVSGQSAVTLATLRALVIYRDQSVTLEFDHMSPRSLAMTNCAPALMTIATRVMNGSLKKHRIVRVGGKLRRSDQCADDDQDHGVSREAERNGSPKPARASDRSVTKTAEPRNTGSTGPSNASARRPSVAGGNVWREVGAIITVGALMRSGSQEYLELQF
jgi:hypothetical protein